jgi:hypothetical protein
MGGWIGGQADYVRVPYADFNLLKFPDITLDRAPEGYQQFDKGAAKTFVLDPHGTIEAA